MESFSYGTFKKASLNPFRLAEDKNRGIYETCRTGIETLLNWKKDIIIPYDESSPSRKNLSVPIEKTTSEMGFALRSPLANISLAAEILETGRLSNEEKMLIDILLRNTARLSALITNYSQPVK